MFFLEKYLRERSPEISLRQEELHDSLPLGQINQNDSRIVEEWTEHEFFADLKIRKKFRNIMKV